MTENQDRAYRRIRTEEDFWASVNMIDDPHSCWLWTGRLQRNSAGSQYAIISFEGKTISAARWVAERYPIGREKTWLRDAEATAKRRLSVLHRCGNSYCLRPDHLRAQGVR